MCAKIANSWYNIYQERREASWSKKQTEPFNTGSIQPLIRSDGLFADSCGHVTGSPKYYRRYEKKLAKAQRILSRRIGSQKGFVSRPERGAWVETFFSKNPLSHPTRDAWVETNRWCKTLAYRTLIRVRAWVKTTVTLTDFGNCSPHLIRGVRE